MNKRNTQIVQKVFALTLKSICDVESYAHNFTREQKFVRDQIKTLGGHPFI